MIGIYKIINKINGNYYVGSSKKIRIRWKSHRHQLRYNKHKNPKLQNAWNKYGNENFEFCEIEETNLTDLLLVEQKYLDVAKTEKERCYNLSFLVGGNSGASNGGWKENNKHLIRKCMSEETKMKISKSLTGSKKSEGMKHKRRLFLMTLPGHKPKEFTTLDSKIYSFLNEITGEKFNGTRTDFRLHFGIPPSTLNPLIRGEKNQLLSGWKMGDFLKEGLSP